MISMMFFFVLIMYFLNIFSFLHSLVYLEFMSLFIFFFLTYMVFNFYSLKIVLFYFVFIVSESAVGLSIFMNCLKFFGSSSFKSMNLTLF